MEQPQASKDGVDKQDQTKSLLGMTEDKLRLNPKLPFGLSLHRGNGGKERFK